MSDRFERLVEDTSSSLLMKVSVDSGEPALRTWALDHAAEVDDRRGTRSGIGRPFGTLAIARLMGASKEGFIANGGKPTGAGVLAAYPEKEPETLALDRTHVKILQSVMRAFGMEENEGIRISSDWSQGHTAVDFDYSIPGVAFVEEATDTIASPPPPQL